MDTGRRRRCSTTRARVPLILAGPGVTATGGVATAPAELVALYPTLAELAQLGIPAHCARGGATLVPTLQDPNANPHAAALTQYGSGYSLRTKRYRYTQWGPDGSDGVELYDHQTDPQEMHNLAETAAHHGLLSQLAEQLRIRIDWASQPPTGLRQIRVENRR